MSYEDQYYDPTHEAGYAGARNLIRVNERGKPLSEREKKRIYEWLSNQDAYTLHRPIRRKFPRLQYNVSNVDDVWECDLLQLTTIKNHNDGYCYLLVVIDVLSKYAWVEPLRIKTARSTAAAFEKILDRSENRVPVLLQSDRGTEFVGSEFQSVLKKHDIKFRVARNPDVKAAVVERLNRTIRERMWRYFSHKNTKRYIDVIQDIVHAYNHTLHSGTKMRPFEVNLYNAEKARQNLRKRALSQTSNRRRGAYGTTAKYSIGDHVRISRSKQTFEKGYEKNFSEEVFKIKRVAHRQNIYTYILEDLNGEEIDGFFYTEELVLVGKDRMKSSELFKVERIIQTKGRGANKQVLVKWLGYPDKFNSWLPASDIETI